jgi:hypothetical protein
VWSRQWKISPFTIMSDPVQHPNFNIITDIGQTDTKVLYSRTLLANSHW